MSDRRIAGRHQGFLRIVLSTSRHIPLGRLCVGQARPSTGALPALIQQVPHTEHVARWPWSSGERAPFSRNPNRPSLVMTWPTRT